MKPSQAIELISNVENSDDLLLHGLDGIQNASIEFSSAHYHKYITDQNSVENVFGLGPENIFFYSLLCFRDNVVVRHESGAGYAYKVDDKTYFRRSVPIYYGKDINDKRLVKTDNIRFECFHDCTSVLISSVPQDYALPFYDKNCILVSKDKFVPVAMKLPDNSFLARVDDNDVSGVSFDSKEFSNIVGEALVKYGKQLSLKASKLSVNKLSVKQFQIEPSTDTSVKKGTFIYDEITDTVKFYNGEKWRTLQWVDEEKPE